MKGTYKFAERNNETATIKKVTLFPIGAASGFLAWVFRRTAINSAHSFFYRDYEDNHILGI